MYSSAIEVVFVILLFLRRVMMNEILNQEEIDYILAVCSENPEKQYRVKYYFNTFLKHAAILLIVLFFIKSVFS